MAEILIEGRRLDVMKGLDFSFNYSIADIRDPNKRSTNYSKTIKCPSTKNNDALFGQIWSVNISNNYNANATNIETNFNPNKKAQALVVQDGVTVMSGVVQLRAITVQNDVYNYEVVFIGNIKTIFSELGDKQLNDFDENGNYYVDFSDLDHKLTYSNVTNSWSNTTGYVYPMIDYGIRFEYTGLGRRIYDIECWRPAVYLKDIFDRIFSFAGFSYTSSFLNSSPFTKLIVPYHAEEFTLTDDQIEQRQFIAETDIVQDIIDVSGATTESINNSFYYIQHLEFIDASDPNNLWNESTDRYTCNEIGYYDFSFVGNWIATRYSTTPPQSTGVLQIPIRVMKESGGVVSEIDQTTMEIAQPPFGIGSAQTTVNWSTSSELLQVGDQVWIEVMLDVIIYTFLQTRIRIELQTGATFANRVSDESITEGLDVYMNNFSPSVKMADILLGVFKMFNLYVTVDESNPTNLIIETRDEFYAGGKIIDWTKKLDRSSKTTIKPLALLSAKEYIYTYSEDDDYYNNRYKDTRGKVYGSRTIDIDNDFLTNDNEIEVAFSATPLANDDNTSRIIPRIYDDDIDDGAKPVDIGMRVLYYNGLIPSNPTWVFRYNNEQSTFDYSTYPYAGHWDNPITPTLDINFGLPKQLYYSQNGYTGVIQVTNANLFNLYHRAHILEITSKDSKVMQGEFYLDALDIQKLDFRDQIVIDNSYWRINKVSDYNPFKEGLTKVELFKALDVFPQEVSTLNIGQLSNIGSELSTLEKMPYTKDVIKANGNQYPLARGIVKGQKNKVSQSAMNFKILGDRNYIGDGSKNVSIVGNNNYVAFGASNVVIINSDNQTVNESNTTIIDGKRIWQYVSIDSDYTANDRDFVLADATSGAITVTLPAVSDDIWVAVKKTDSSANAVTVSAAVTGLIDGSANITLSSQYDAVDVYSDGTNWHIR